MSTSAALAVDRTRQHPVRRRSERLAVETRRRQLLELGVKIVGKRRYEEPWLEEVARTADISKGLIYHYFETKRAYYVQILRHIAESLAQRWEETVSPLVDNAAPADAVIAAGLDAYLDFAVDYPAAFRTLIEAGGGIDPEVKQVDAYLRDQLISHIARFYREEDLPPTVRAGVNGWAAFVEQVSMDWLEQEALSREEAVAMMKKVLRSILPAN